MTGDDAGDWTELADAADTEDELLVDLPVLAVVGRQNVGKSTLVNRILGRREAVVARAGQTSLIENLTSGPPPTSYGHVR